MTLLITVIAAVVSTVVWYSSEKARELKIGVLLYMFWGASLMIRLRRTNCTAVKL